MYVQIILNEIYDVFVNEHNSNLIEQNFVSNAQECTSSNYSISAIDQGGLKIYESFLRSVEMVHQPVKSELEIYFENGVYIP